MEEMILLFLFTIAFLFIIKATFTYLSTVQKYKAVESKKEYSGCEVARVLLDQNGLKDVYVVTVKGFLKDHYDTRRKVIRLSQETFDGSSLAMIAVSARECAHAIQDQNHHVLLRMRGAIQPFLEIVLYLGYIGVLFSLISWSLYYLLLSLGVILFVFLFHLCTLSIEKEAVRIALREIEKANLVTKKEMEGVEEVLQAGTYLFVASPLLLIIQLIKGIFVK